MDLNAKSPVKWGTNNSTEISPDGKTSNNDASIATLASTAEIKNGELKIIEVSGDKAPAAPPAPPVRKRMKTVSYDDYKFGSDQAQEEAQRKFFKEEKERLAAVKALEDAKERGADESEIQ